MTKNQIDYFNARENRRHNLVVEGHSDRTINENIRHNMSTEAINWANVNELSRHNIANELVSLMNIEELYRSNTAKEEETARHNLANEAYNQQALTAEQEFRNKSLEMQKFSTEVSTRSNIISGLIGAGSRTIVGVVK